MWNLIKLWFKLKLIETIVSLIIIGIVIFFIFLY